MDPNEIPDRRQFLKRIVIAGAAGTLFSVRGAFAEELVRTPSQTEGPYYPLQLPLDRRQRPVGHHGQHHTCCR